MEKTVITWNIENWITVFLMVILGLSVLKAAGSLISRVKGSRGGKTAD